MINKAKNKLKRAGSAIKSSVIKSKNVVRSYRWRLFQIFIVLASISLIVSLVMSAIKGVRIIDQAVIINHSQSRIIQGSYSNQQTLIGLGSTLFTIPKRKFMIYFGTEIKPDDENYYAEAINARIVEGTKIIVSGMVSCQIRVDNLRNFLEEYGLNWQKYIIAKTENSIIQRLATTRFYDLNNTRLIEELNKEYQGYNSLSFPEKYPFHVQFISLKLRYPDRLRNSSLDTNSGTVGMQLILKKSEYTQLYNHYTSLSQKITKDSGEIEAYSLAIGKLEGEIKRYQKQLEGSLHGWRQGLVQLRNVYDDPNSKELRQFLWLYFQKMYNGTYNTYTL